MVIKKVPQIGNPILRKKTKSLTFTDIRDSKTKKVIEDLTDTMRDAKLVGMAAPQIGESVRIFITEIRAKSTRPEAESSPLKVYINPRINWKSKEVDVGYEGCGSVFTSQLFGPVERFKSIEVEYDDSRGRRHKEKVKGDLSIIIQHELDHLDGILFTDRIIDNKKIMDRKSYIKYINEQRAKEKEAKQKTT